METKMSLQDVKSVNLQLKRVNLAIDSLIDLKVLNIGNNKGLTESMRITLVELRAIQTSLKIIIDDMKNNLK